MHFALKRQLHFHFAIFGFACIIKDPKIFCCSRLIDNVNMAQTVSVGYCVPGVIATPYRNL